MMSQHNGHHHSMAPSGGPGPEGVNPADPDQLLDVRLRGHGDGRTEVAVTGEIDFSSHKVLLGALMDEVEQGHTRIVLDLSEVAFCDSTGLGVLVQVRQRAIAGGGWLRLVGVTQPVRRALEITNLDRIIPSYRTVAEATAAAG
jgi:anti-sigma B factor antagonist